MEIELGTSGRLMKPGFHDGYLLGVELVGSDAAAVNIRNLSGERYSLNLSGVERLLCNGFAEGNIVSEVYLVSGTPPPLPSLRLLMAPPHASAAEEYHAKYEMVLRHKVDLVEQRELTFVAIEPSYGCELFALCKSVEIATQQT